MTHFLSCDWGTSTFRLRLVDTATLSVLAEVKNTQGCARTNQGWLKENGDEQERMNYYLRIISSQLQEIKEKTTIATAHIPLVISGMASSTIGMTSLPYKEAPFLADGTDLKIKLIGETENLPHRALIVSGVRTADDVMRGEETKLVGCPGNDNYPARIIVLPGTHPKHAYATKKQVTGFKTYMTGEFFELLSQKSLLALSVKENPDFDAPAFTKGVKEGADGNLLHSSFLVRTNTLFERYTPEQNLYYLSGLLMGSELKDLISADCPITLLANEKSGFLYKKAFDILRISLSEIADADKALISGQYMLLKNLEAAELKKKGHGL